MSNAVVQCVGVSRVYGAGDREVVALRDVDLSIPPCAFAAVIGRSGSGKTTLLNVMGGLDQPSAGEVLLSGRPIGGLSDDERTELWRHEVGFVFQSFALLPTLSAYDNVALPLRITGTAAEERDERVSHCLELVGLEEWAGHRPYELSGGQQQRIAVARALVHRPRLILADEPTGELDSETAREVFSLFSRLIAEEGVTVVVASHDPLVHQYATLAVRLTDGRVQQPTQD
ncbi:MAG: ABC transporter ATP-binding protein [Anaerolineales bacterium]|nr:MAG: ABC transporter ATP-binding protein [Anaerolineales bacterium]